MYKVCLANISPPEADVMGRMSDGKLGRMGESERVATAVETTLLLTNQILHIIHTGFHTYFETHITCSHKVEHLLSAGLKDGSIDLIHPSTCQSSCARLG